MISVNPERVERSTLSEATPRRFGPWPWYLSAADFIGLDVDVVDDMAGDLVEECAGASGTSGVIKRVWCAGQVVRSLPYLVTSTLRRGQSCARRRLVAAMTALVAAMASVIAAVEMHVGPPARISADHGFDTNDIVINNVGVVQMPVRAIDARGHTVAKAAIHYEQVSGDPIDIGEAGAVSCLSRGDAVVRASVDDVSSLVTMHCRPVFSINTTVWRFDFLPGDPPRVVRLEARDASSNVVKEVRGEARVVDASVATLHRSVLVPRGVGASHLTVSIGDTRLNVPVVVHEIVDRFDNLSLAQRHVAMPLRLSPGDTLHLPVPAGTIWVKWMSRDGTTAHPALTADGPGYCHMDSEAFIRWLPSDEYGAYCEMSEGARIRIAWSGASEQVLTGALLLERLPRGTSRAP